MRLSPETFARAALKLLNKSGLEGVSLRKLGDELGVQGPALYAHFKNKQELLDLMAEIMLDEALAPLDAMTEVADWHWWLAERARTIRRTLLSYRDGALLHAGSRPTADGAEAIPALLRPLREAGFSDKEALTVIITISRYTLGCVIDEQRPGDDPAPQPDPGADDTFEFGLQALLSGLGARLPERVPDSAG
ncbi:TetR/AcrR family transcriptional regulator C-terminal domain-containing protein [Amycolatopsis panacis]|uniref:TetR family transcriptional regulator n=1 Tax=Amycolatopsis panacis TaxID=2340917 RepID=A0A419I6M9_9PSEU|nr:TetR/AcrR family transcriptional regulator C-terminal domain-containing protein [Amycolatopsis panacis]RJQ86847.1 TetR family transcriptional regulator [Amycolatopsis panacis]